MSSASKNPSIILPRKFFSAIFRSRNFPPKNFAPQWIGLEWQIKIKYHTIEIKKLFCSDFFHCLIHLSEVLPNLIDVFLSPPEKNLIKFMFCVNNKFCVKNSFFHYFWSEAEVWFCLSCSVLLSIINFGKSIPLNCPQISFLSTTK